MSEFDQGVLHERRKWRHKIDSFWCGTSAILFFMVVAPAFFDWMEGHQRYPGWIVLAALIFCGVALWQTSKAKV